MTLALARLACSELALEARVRVMVWLDTNKEVYYRDNMAIHITSCDKTTKYLKLPFNIGGVDDFKQKLISTTKWCKGALNLCATAIQVLTVIEHRYALFTIVANDISMLSVLM